LIEEETGLGGTRKKKGPWGRKRGKRKKKQVLLSFCSGKKTEGKLTPVEIKKRDSKESSASRGPFVKTKGRKAKKKRGQK